MKKFKVGVAGVGQRADVFVSDKFAEFARSALSGLFDEGLVLVNSQPAKSGQKLHLDDQIQVDDSLLKAKPAVIEIPVIYEDENVVVMDKPAGILTHNKGALNTESTVASFLKSKITDEKLIGNRAGIVHRLDRATSGVIIGAKNDESLKYLQKQFSNHKTKKTYLAVVEGLVELPEAVIDAPIERNPKRPQTFRVNSTGKAAQTAYRTLKQFGAAGKRYTFLELKPVTGRTHQLRVHLKYIGHPIVGDKLYGHEGFELLLHAQQLELTLPGNQRRTFQSQAPNYFNDFIDHG
jgi:23S rRNA pseudouridine1911/1915/1917 synthase